MPKDQAIRCLCKSRQGITLIMSSTLWHSSILPLFDTRQQTRVAFGMLSVRARHRSYQACRLDISGHVQLYAEVKTFPVFYFHTRLSCAQE
jgi:hypothetical protein